MKKILFVLHLPPPVHGASVMGKTIQDCKALNEAYETSYVNLALAADLKEVSRFSFCKPAAFLRVRRKICEAVRQVQPDLVYMTPAICLPGFLKDVLYVQMLKRMGCKLVLHLHNKEHKWMKSRLFRPLYRRFFAHTKVILLSERLYPDIAPFIGRDSVSICPNGVKAASVEHVGGTIPQILFLSNIIRSKGVSILLDACRLLVDQGLSFHCELVGKETGDYSAASLEAEIRQKGLDDRVYYAGPKYGMEKWSALSRADIFVFPSWYSAECFPLVLLEAMAAGLPVITTDAGAIPDIVQDGENGFICPTKDAVSVAEAIRKLLINSDLRKEMGECGHRRFQKEFTVEAFESRLIGILKQELGA